MKNKIGATAGLFLAAGVSYAAPLPGNLPGGVDGTSILHDNNSLFNGSSLTNIFNGMQTSINSAQSTADSSIPLTQKGASSGVASLDASSRTTYPVISPGVLSATGGADRMSASDNTTIPNTGLFVKNPFRASYQGNGTSLNFSNPSSPRELMITAFAGGDDVLGLWNTDPSGYSALSLFQDDAYVKTVKGIGHGGFGYAGGQTIGALTGILFTETDRFDYTSNPLVQPSPYAMFWTGGEFTSYQEANAVITNQSNTIKCLNCTFPAGINGYLIDTPNDYGFISPNTTIVSGAGTNTLTLSKVAANSSQDGSVGNWVVFGPTAFHQYDSVYYTQTGGIHYYTYPCASDGHIYCDPFLNIERLNGRVGIDAKRPIVPLDVGGATAIGIDGDVSDRNQWATQGVLNVIAHPGEASTNSTAINIYGKGVGNLNFDWMANPSRLALYDPNHNALLQEWYQDGSGWSRQLAAPIQQDSTQGQYTARITDCGTTIVLNTAKEVIIPTGLPIGCAIDVFQEASSGQSYVSGSTGMSVGWSKGQRSYVGNYVLTGQFSRAHVVVEYSYFASVSSDTGMATAPNASNINGYWERLGIPAGGSAVLADYEGGNPGRLTTLNIALAGSGVGGNKDIDQMQLQFFVDGETTPSSTWTMGVLGTYGAKNFNSSSLRCSGNANQVIHGCTIQIDVPFTKSLKVVASNANGAGRITSWGWTQGDLNMPIADARFSRLHTISGGSQYSQQVTVQPYAEQTLVDMDGQGAFFGLNMFLDFLNTTSGSNASAIEGNYRVYVDGIQTPVYVSSGTEDFFGSSFGFMDGIQANDDYGTTFLNYTDENEGGTDESVQGYRFMHKAPIYFNTHIKVTWQSCDPGYTPAPTTPTNIAWQAYVYTTK